MTAQLRIWATGPSRRLPKGQTSLTMFTKLDAARLANLQKGQKKADVENSTSASEAAKLLNLRPLGRGATCATLPQ